MNFEEARKADKMMVKGEFVHKEIQGSHGWFYVDFSGRISEKDIVLETEKAVKIRVTVYDFDDNKKEGSVWVPKSCIWSVDDEEAHKAQFPYSERYKAWEAQDKEIWDTIQRELQKKAK